MEEGGGGGKVAGGWVEYGGWRREKVGSGGPVSQLLADHLGVVLAPVVATHGAPVS